VAATIGFAGLLPFTQAAPAAQAADVESETPPTWTFHYTGGPQTFTVPENTTRLTIEAWGGRGGDPNQGGQGGAGGEVTAGLDVTGVSALTIWVGQNAGRAGGWGFSCGGEGALATVSPRGAYDGGGGGGASAVTVGATTTGAGSCDAASRPAGDPVVLAGGGGGGGGQEHIPLTDYNGGKGGMGGAPPTDGQIGMGDGGSPGGRGGGAGTSNGSAGQGPANQTAGGAGGGGGGWIAGGAGGGGQGGHREQGNGAVFAGSGGGGGTSFASDAAIDEAFSLGSRGASGRVVITGYLVKTFSDCSKKAEHWSPPHGVATVAVSVEGASGGHRRGSNAEHAGDGGHGGIVTATLTDVDWSKVDVSVGCAGTDGGDGGGGWGFGHGGSKGRAHGGFGDDGAGGGGGSAVAYGSTPLVVAGGGGGGGGGTDIPPFGWEHGGDGGDGVAGAHSGRGPGHDGEGASAGSGGCAGWNHDGSTTGDDGGRSTAVNDGGGGGGGGGGWKGACGGQGGGSETAGGGGGGGGSFAALSTSIGDVAFHVSERTEAHGRITFAYAPPGSHDISVTAGAGQSAPAGGGAFSDVVEVRVTDAAGQPWPNAPVTFTAPSSGPSASLGNGDGTIYTDENGIAEIGRFSIVTNDVAGPWSLVASTPGVSEPASIDLTNSAVPTSVSLSSDPGSPSTAGQPVVFFAIVSAPESLDTPTGSVQFAVDGADFGAPVALSGAGAQSPALDTLSPGLHTVTALYSGSAEFAVSSAKLSQQVVPTATATAVTSSANPSSSGQAVTFGASVSVKAGGFSPGTPTGTVQFQVDGVAVGSPVVLDASGEAVSEPTDSLTDGAHTVTAVYSGAGAFAPSTGLVVQQVDPGSTAVAVRSSLNPSTFGEPVTIVADLGDAAAGGSVQFTLDGTPIGAPVAVTGGLAQSEPLSPDAGSRVILAHYSGDAQHAAGTGGMIQTVERAASVTGLSSSLDPAVVGDAVTFTASITTASGGDAALTGSVQFTIGGEPFGASVAVTEGRAVSPAVGTLPVGGHEVAALYSGDPNRYDSTGHLLQRMLAAGTQTTVASSVDPAVTGQSTTFTAETTSDSAGAGVPTGVVQFVIDGEPVGSLVDLVEGRGELVAPTDLATGRHQVTALYLGDASHEASSSRTTLTVDRASTAVSLTTGDQTGDTLGLAVVLNVTPPGAGVPGGLVEVRIDGVPAGDPVLAVAGEVTLSVPLPASGTHRVEAVYSGDRRFAGSSASTTVTIGGGGGGGSGGASTPAKLAATGGPAPELPLVAVLAVLLVLGGGILGAASRGRRRHDAH
jgi:hypothetical protein